MGQADDLGWGDGMGGLETPPLGSGQLQHLSSRQHFATIAWLRWRIFANTLRGKGAAGELAAKILSYPFLALIILGPAVGSGLGAWYFVSQGKTQLLAIPLWIIFGLWQLIAMNTSATGPSFDLGTLIRFPLRYRDYFLIRVSFGLMDPPTIAGIACLFAASIGIGIADPALYPYAALLLAIYAACNLFFSRMIYSWLERWLAQRRTRELMTGIFILISIGFQFVAQFAQRIGHEGRHAPQNPWLLKAFHAVVAVNWFLPPGLTASSIDHMHRGALLMAMAALGGLLAFTVAFILVLHLRLSAQFRGEDLSEAPAQASRRSAAARANEAESGDVGSRYLAFLPATVAACLVKEVRYLLRSGPRLYVLIMPVFIVVLFAVRSSGMEYSGLGPHRVKGMLFAYGCAYMQLIFVSLIYNSVGSDGAGVQFYFLAPLRIRDAMLAKNLLVFGIFVIEAVLIYACSVVIGASSSLDLVVATLVWSVFTLLLNTSIGNIRSIVAPKRMDATRMRGQNVSGFNSVISLGVIAVCVALAAGMLLVSEALNAGYWLAAGVFAVLAVGSFAVYMAVLGRIDAIAASHAEDLTRELSKA